MKNKKSRNKFLCEAKVIIIIINYNTEQETIKCLQSLKKLKYKNFEIILIDNNSDNFNKIKDFTKKNCELRIKNYELNKNTGFTGGVNFGIKKALKNKTNIDYIWLLNNDALVDKNTLTELVKTAKEKNSAVTGAKIFSLSKNIIKLKNLEADGGTFNWIQGSFPKGAIKNPKWITGTSMLIKKNIFEIIGLFDEKFFLYYEDVDFCFRLKKNGFKLSVSEKAFVSHKKSSSTNMLGKDVILYYHYRNLMLLTKKHAPKIIKYIIYLWSYFLILRYPFSKYIKYAIYDFHNNKFGKFNH